ncbi:unknown [Clostridium sp. CAG:768]|uniref:hypothetical protein n=1 Tax=Candidatus Stercorousia sp. TaxID=3048886 RepID=UPI000334B143|nr:unknown [Clostridium sp. CAG:768]
MITVNPVKFNTVKPISFGEGNLNNLTPNVAILSLQNPNAKINFENDLNRTQKADMVQNPNMLNALGAKLRKTYNILFSPDYDRASKSPKHISFLG